MFMIIDILEATASFLNGFLFVAKIPILTIGEFQLPFWGLLALMVTKNMLFILKAKSHKLI